MIEMYQVNNNNRFNQRTPSIYHVSQEQARNLISKDVDNYASGMTFYDMYARQCKNFTEVIQKSLLDFYLEPTTLDQCFKRCLSCIDEANKRLERITLTFNSIDWHLCFFKGINYEDGLAHTRFNFIFLPASKILTISDEQLTRLLVHEKIHVIQKVLPFDNFITNFMKNFSVVGHRYYVDKFIRCNPDLDDFVYTNNKGELMKFVYASERPSSIFDIVKLSQYEHPYEEMAYIYSNL
jgi:hypothetical protein